MLSRFCASLEGYLEQLPQYGAAFLSRYSAFINGDSIEALRTLSADSVAILYYFFDWVLSRKTGKDGRRLTRTKKRSSLGTYWKVFRLVFERATGDKLDAKLNRKMHRVPTPLPLLAKKC